jgi:hypothetical protein
MKTVFIDQAKSMINNLLVVVLTMNATVVTIIITVTIVVSHRKSQNQASTVMIIKLNHM